MENIEEIEKYSRKNLPYVFVGNKNDLEEKR